MRRQTLGANGAKDPGLRSRLALALVLLLAVAGPAVQGRAAQGTDPQQAVVFDGSFDAADTFVVSLSSQLQIDVGAGGFTCPGATYVSPGGLVALEPQDLPVQGALSGLGISLATQLFAQPALTPESIQQLVDDCDVVSEFSGVKGYLSQVSSDAAADVSAVQVCAAQVEQTYCDIVAAVEAATLVDGTLLMVDCLDFLPNTFLTGSGLLGFCTGIRNELAHRPAYLLDAIDFEFARCEDARAEAPRAPRLHRAGLDHGGRGPGLRWRRPRDRP